MGREIITCLFQHGFDILVFRGCRAWSRTGGIDVVEDFKVREEGRLVFKDLEEQSISV